MNILSVFDGICCARIALDRAGVTYDKFYTQSVSNSQRYRLIGKGWTVDAIAHILRDMSTVATPTPFDSFFTYD